MIKIKNIFILSAVLFVACTGTKKYFKAAEKLEKQGLVNEAAEFYYESLQRKTTNVDARIKLKEVGQKYVSFMASEFFRDYNTGNLEPSIQMFERMKEFTGRTSALNVVLSYPSAYEEDYQDAIQKYCVKNYATGEDLVKQKKYNEALPFLKNVKKYKPEYKKVVELHTIAVCEPLYQNAITLIETKNYGQALTSLKNIESTTQAYKDSKELLDLCVAQQTKDLLLFQPKNTSEKTLVDYLFDNFSQAAMQNGGNVNLINNSPFVYMPDNDIEGNVDLIQAIKKATGADYFYIFDVSNKRSNMRGPQKAPSKCFRKVVYKKNDTLIVTEYQPTDYYQIKMSRVYSYDFKFKLINANTNQIVSMQTVVVSKTDEVEYNEFMGQPKSGIDDYFPYNPQTTAPLMQYNPKSWRKLFSANKVVKSEQELESMANQESVKIFNQTITSYIK